MNEENKSNIGEETRECMSELSKKFDQMQDKMLKGIDQAFKSTAEKLDNTAESMQKTAAFFRHKDIDSMKEDAAEVVRSNPGKSIAAALLAGIVLGKIILR